MNDKTTCPLCSGKANLFKDFSGRRYYTCTNCQAIFLDPHNFLSPENEKKRYLKHNNDIADIGYLASVQPIIRKIKENFSEKHQGLDFGAGPEQIIARLLGSEGYELSSYDPFFCNEPAQLEKAYDYIACCEVMEHFRAPSQEFALLRSLLKEQGKLFCLTSIYDHRINFEEWYYKNDQTHHFFYHQDSLQWIKSAYNFSGLTVQGKLIEFAV